ESPCVAAFFGRVRKESGRAPITAHPAVVAVVLASMMTFAAYAQQPPAAENVAPAGPAATAELKEMSLEQACPKTTRGTLTPDSLTTGKATTEEVSKLASAMKTCINRLQLALNALMGQKGDDVWNKIDSSLNQAIVALQSRITELKGQGGLIETVKLYLN